MENIWKAPEDNSVRSLKYTLAELDARKGVERYFVPESVEWLQSEIKKIEKLPDASISTRETRQSSLTDPIWETTRKPQPSAKNVASLTLPIWETTRR